MRHDFHPQTLIRSLASALYLVCTKTCHQFPSAMLPSCMSSSKFPTRICIGLHTGYPSNPIIHPRFSSDFMGVGISPSPPIPSGDAYICNFGGLLGIFSYVDRKTFEQFVQSMQPPLLLCLLPLQVTLHGVVYTPYVFCRGHESPLGY